MFLKSVELYGFKSFADRTKFEFSNGITSLLGPNGSGKSNVVDAIKWVLGTQALSQLRAGKKEDVIFNGTDTRKMMPMCEVLLTLNNEEGLLKIDAAEVELKRRMFRTGENEYFINREKVLLKDVKDLFMDTGVGKSAYSILEQGRIDQILSLKPEDRRYIFEEAAGISRFKSQSEDANRKLDRTDENLSQVEILYKEQEKILNSRKNQLDKVLKSRELAAKKETLEVELQLSYVQTLTKLKNLRQTELAQKEQEYETIDNELQQKKSGLSEQQEVLESLRIEREKLNSSNYRYEEQIIAMNREINIYNERYHEVHQRAKEALFKVQKYQDKLQKDKVNLEEKEEILASLKDNIETVKLSIEKVIAEIDNTEKTREKYNLEIDKLKHDNENLAEKKIEITTSISLLANEITEKLQTGISGSEYSSTLRAKTEKNFFEEVKKASNMLRERIKMLQDIVKVNLDKEVFLQEFEKIETEIQAELDEIKGIFQEYCGMIPVFLDEFVSPQGILSKKTELDEALQNAHKTELENKAQSEHYAEEIERLSKMLILKQDDLNDLKLQQVQYSAKVESLSVQIAEQREELSQMEFDFSDAQGSIETEKNKELETQQRITELERRQTELKERLEQNKTELQQIISQIELKSNEITQHNSDFQKKFERKQQLMTEIATDKANLESLDSNIQKVYTDFFDDTGKSLREFDNHEITTPVDELKSELERVKKHSQELGYINYMAEEEYNEAKKSYDFYKKNYDDLTKAKNDLLEVITEIKTKSEEMFLSTFDNINKAFTEMFTTLFGGGRAKLTLADETNILQSGIEIQAQPPGKKMAYLPALSGGEKSMTAVALLFATYKVKPSPFCVLDEIDAALDARNIGAFMKVLEKFENKSQFIIITHNKNTVLGSDCLLGVTQQEAGVSKAIGYKLDSNEAHRSTQDTLKG